MESVKIPVIKTDRLTIRLPEYRDIDSIINYYYDNKEYLKPFEPIKPNDFYSRDYWIAHIDLIGNDFNVDRSLKLFIFDNSIPKQIIGMVCLNNIVRGAFQASYLGYSLAESKQGNGYMMEALEGIIDYAFSELKLHRIMANYMPHNKRSGNILKKLGFIVEGYARDYLFINGKWEDHILTSISNNKWC
ncbi:MAG: ribosomal protein S5-alanine N-acetyltransferase [Vulcanibacillus sp.]